METSKHKKRVLVVSRNYNNLLCMARSLAGGDYDIELVRIIQLNYKVLKLMAKFNPERQCRYITRYHVCQTNRDPEKFVKFLMDIYDPDRETLIISCDDLSIPWIDENYDKLKKYYHMCSINDQEGALARLMNKQVQKKLALDFGLPTAMGRAVTVREQKYDLPEGISYPCFLKPAVLIMGSKDYLKKYDCEEDLRSALDEMASKFGDLDLLVEDYIDIKKEYAILGISVGDRVLMPDGCLEFVQGGHGSNTGIMSKGRVVSNPEILSFMNTLSRFIGTLGYTGMFDVDALASNDRIHFCEINFRFGGSGYAITKCGVNIPKMYAEYIFNGKALPGACRLDGIGKYFVSEKILMEDATERYISKGKAEREIRKADIHFIMDEDDPQPYKRFRLYFRTTAKLMMALKRGYKKIRH